MGGAESGQRTEARGQREAGAIPFLILLLILIPPCRVQPTEANQDVDSTPGGEQGACSGEHVA